MFAYLSGEDEKEQAINFRGLKNFMHEFRISGVNIKLIFLGDVNARTGNEQGWSEELDRFLETENFIDSVRSSRDSAVNRKGKQFLELCDNANLLILNGRIDRDRNGKHTFISLSDASVIDYCCASVNSVKFINSLRIGNILFCDHMPLELNITIGRESIARRKVCYHYYRN